MTIENIRIGGNSVCYYDYESILNGKTYNPLLIIYDKEQNKKYFMSLNHTSIKALLIQLEAATLFTEEINK